MFLFHIAFSLGLIALAAGVLLFDSLKQHAGSAIGKILALLIIIFALISTVCTAYCGVDLWRQGYFKHLNMNTEHTAPMQDTSMKKAEAAE